MEAPGVRKDGSEIFLQLSFGEYRKGDIHVFTGFIRDITEAKLQADALKRSEHNFRALVQATTEYVWRLDERGNLLEFPQWWVDLTGQSYEDSLKYGWVQMVHPDDQERVRTQYAEALANGTSVSLELRIRNRQGKYRHYSANGVPIPGEAGPRWICALTDISAQRKLEERYKVVSSMSADYMFAAEVDANGNLSMDWVAGALEAITGRGEEYFRNGGTWRSIVHPDDRAQEDADAAAVFEGRQVESEIRIVRPDGETVWVCRLARPVWDDEANRVAAIVGAVKDVTERKSAELAVREREEYLRMVLNAEPQSVAVFGPSGELLDVNPAGVAMLEAASEEKITGRNVLAFLAAADREPFIAALGRAFAGEDVSVTYQMKGLLGTERRMDMCAVPIRNSDGEITSVLGVSRDITERHRIQAALVESEKQYSDLINTVEGIVWEVDISTMRFTFVSQQAESMLGFPLERWYEDHFWADQIHPEDRDFAINYCAAETAKGEGHSFEYRMMAADGSVVWLRDIVSVVVEEGKPVKLRGIMVDVTEQRRLDAAMKQQAVLIEQSNEAIFVWDLDHGVIEWNLGCEKLYGYKRDEALGLFPYDLLHSRFPDSVQDFREELSAAGSWNGELTQATAAGDELIVESRVQLIELNGRKVVLQTSRDLTEMRRAEAALLASEEQLRQAQKLESIGILAGGLAHDFNNMLTAINGYSDLILRRTAKDNPIRSYLEEIKKAGERSADLTRQLLAFSRRQILQPSLLDLNAVIDDTTSLLKRLIGADITIDTRLAADLWRIKADHGQLTQVLMNLMINARDAMPDGGSVTIETDNVELDEEYAGNTVGVMPGRYVMLAISDTGIGMDEETRSRVFEPFFTTKPVGRGTGLGLSTVYGIVKQSGGNVWVYSEPGRGSTFKVYLPQAAGEPEALHAGTERRQMHMGSEKILLVEDEDSVRRLAKQILETCGYEVYEASNGAAAFSEFEKEWAEIDLLVTDVVMPGMGGRELSEMARERRPDLKVLFTSGYTDDAVVRRGILDEGHNFLQKPFTFDALARKVRTVLDETSVRPYSPSRLLTHFQNESS
jgi:PAS domain S-box-containing protein